MSIKNFKPYSNPNPVILKQHFWDENEKIIIHNKFGQRHVKETNEDLEFDISKIKQEETKQEEIKIVESVEPKSKQVSRDFVDVWCLPCLKYNESVDSLYNENYATVEYGDKFIFNAKIVDSEDLYIRLITSQKLTEYSVIYPKTKDRRWWKVRSVQDMDKMYVIICEISDYQPSFVD